jgi:S1-C subfamily serine protease
LIVDVKPGSPAEKALLVGDVIVAFDGQPVEAPEDLLDLLSGDRVGREVPIRIVRGDSVTDVRVTIADRADRQ